MAGRVSARRLGTQTVTRVRAGTVTDRYGEATRDWAAASRVQITGCAVQPAGSTENLAGGDQRITAWHLIAPITPDILATDRIEWDGARKADGTVAQLEVDGEVGRWADPPAHVEAVLRRVEG
jgi:hypothetical protein